MEIEHQEDYTKKLYEASIKGRVDTLNILLRKDPLILDRILVTSFDETPLHIASLLGHVDFAVALLHHKSEFSSELNSKQQSPLHLASARGYTEIVKALLGVNTDVCLVLDQHGRIPLHLAAMRGKVEVIQLLVSARPESVRVKLHGKETALHLCVKYNHLDALKFLVACVKEDYEFLNLGNNDGNSILHLALIMNQEETVKYLLSIPEMKVEADVFGTILKNNPLDFENISIQDSKAESRTTRRPLTEQIAATSHQQALAHNEAQPGQSMADNLTKYLDYQGKWMKKARGNLMIVATLIASMAFQAAINPPSRVQDAELNGCQNRTTFKAYTTKGFTYQSLTDFILDSTHKFAYCSFIFTNTISFATSLGTIFLLVCGFPLKKRISMYILLTTIIVTMLFSAATYIISIGALGTTKNKTIDDIAVIYTIFWAGLLAFIVVFHAINFTAILVRCSVWTMKKLYKLVFKARKAAPMMLPAAAF